MIVRPYCLTVPQEIRAGSDWSHACRIRSRPSSSGLTGAAGNTDASSRSRFALNYAQGKASCGQPFEALEGGLAAARPEHKLSTGIRLGGLQAQTVSGQQNAPTSSISRHSKQLVRGVGFAGVCRQRRIQADIGSEASDIYAVALRRPDCLGGAAGQASRSVLQAERTLAEA